MQIKAIAGIVMGSVIALAATGQAQAYKLHYWQDGTVTWMCNDGLHVGVMDDGSMPPEEVIIADCADYGGISTAGDTFGAKAKAQLRIAR